MGFEWTNEFSLEIEAIDEQHRLLVAMISDFYTALSRGKGNEALADTIDGLFFYTSQHFAAEEQLMRDSHYPDVDTHRQIHERMLTNLRTLQDEWRRGDARTALKLAEFLKNWLTKHILTTDRRYAGHVRAHLARKLD